VNILTQSAGAVTAFTVLAGAAVWAADTRYVTVSGLQDLFQQQEMQDLRHSIRELEWDEDHGGLSEKDAYLLEQYRDDLEAMQ